MAKIALQNVEVYIRQLLTETLVKDGGPQNGATDEKLSKDENYKSTHRRLSEKSRDKIDE